MKSKILLKHENKWVALDKKRTKVVYSAISLDSLLKKISEKDKKDVILHYVPPFDSSLSM